VADGLAPATSITTRLSRVAWARHSDILLLVIPNGDVACDLVRVPLAANPAIQTTPAANLGDEPRDSLALEAVQPPAHDRRKLAMPADDVRALFALMRAAQMVGAMEAAVALTVQYANERVQFGRPIGKFQAIQHHIAGMAELLAASTVALEQAAATAHDPGRRPLLWIAKALASESAGEIASVAHQVHGAIGFTREYRLQPLTRRLLSWREECGNEAVWYDKLGKMALKNGADQLWPWLVEMSPSAGHTPV
jgi:acyl-CoA dehydrogenase